MKDKWNRRIAAIFVLAVLAALGWAVVGAVRDRGKCDDACQSAQSDKLFGVDEFALGKKPYDACIHAELVKWVNDPRTDPNGTITPAKRDSIQGGCAATATAIAK